jgi:hypothetical protein
MSSGMLRCAALVRTDVSKELIEAMCSSETSVLTRAARRNIPEDDILHSHRHENLKSYIALTGWTLYQRHNVSPVRYELGFYIPEDAILHSHRREHLKSYIVLLLHKYVLRVAVPTDLFP